MYKIIKACFLYTLWILLVLLVRNTHKEETLKHARSAGVGSAPILMSWREQRGRSRSAVRRHRRSLNIPVSDYCNAVTTRQFPPRHLYAERKPLLRPSIAPEAMGWFSILPAHLSGVETWVARIFVSSSNLAPHRVNKPLMGHTASSRPHCDGSMGTPSDLRFPLLPLANGNVRSPGRGRTSARQSATTSP